MLDWVAASLTYEERRTALVGAFQSFDAKVIEENRVWLVPSVSSDVQCLWNELQSQNVVLSCEMFEGIVAKRGDSLYPIQRQSPQKEFPFWVKHRWRF